MTFNYSKLATLKPKFAEEQKEEVKPPIAQPEIVLDQSDQQTAQKDLDQSKEPSVTKPTVNLAQNELSSVSLAQSEPSLKSARPKNSLAHNELSPNKTKLIVSQVGSYRVPNVLDDEIMPNLPPPEQIVLRRLFRLSHGFNREITDSVSIGKLAEKCNLGDATIKRALKGLQDRGLIEIHSDLSRNPVGGNRYTVLAWLRESIAQNEPSSEKAMLPVSHIKDHDHDLKIHDLHQRETTTVYQSLTGNQWTKKDETAYKQIKNVPVEQIEATIKAVLQRAPNKPATLAYFVKEILSPSQTNPGSRAAKRKDMERIIREVKDAHKHVNGYLMSDFVADVKEACAKEGIGFDNDLFNEITSRTQ